MTTSHAPGPWAVVRRTVIVDAVGSSIASAGNNRAIVGDELDATLRLAAAAPDLLAALTWAVRFIDTYAAKQAGPAAPELNKAREAIARATGAAT